MIYSYLRIQTDTAEGRLGDELLFRKAIQDALARSFGVSGATTHVDVLRLRNGQTATHGENGNGGRVVEDAVIRIAREDAPRLKAALASAPTRLSIIDEANFLSALIASEPLSLD